MVNTHRIDLWRMDLDQDEAVRSCLVKYLAADENERAARFIFDRDRNRYIVGRGFMRLRLGAYLDLDPGKIQLTSNAHGKPELAGQTSGLRFNLSHSGGQAVLAVSPDFELGVDIEQYRNIPEDLAQRYFAAGENAALANLPPSERKAAFFRCWTRKEAFVKAVGSGMSLPLKSFEVSLDKTVETPLLLWDADPLARKSWRFFSFTIGPDIVGALAFDTQGRDVSVNWRSGLGSPGADIAINADGFCLR